MPKAKGGKKADTASKYCSAHLSSYLISEHYGKLLENFMHISTLKSPSVSSEVI